MRAVAIAVVGLVAASCAMAPPLERSSGRAATPAPTTAGGMAVPADTPVPLDPATVGLTCGDDLAFHPVVLESGGHAERDPDAAAAALRAEVAGAPAEAALPRTGWTRVAHLANRVQFVAPASHESGWAVVGFTARDGRWQLEAAGECRLQPVAPEDASIAEWRLDPAFPAPVPDDAVLNVLLRERACAGGKSPAGRVLEPTIVSTEAAVTVTLVVTRLPGSNDCPGNEAFPTTVELPAPLGGRPLFDGGTFPPTGPVTDYELTCEKEGEACRTLAARIVAEAERQHPGRQVTWLGLYDVEGGYYDLGFDDGTMLSRHP